ncbi:BOB1 [Scenedesmus sp. PABB004]|nr:BOB1 [Scenedesmus sp. PABB004]
MAERLAAARRHAVVAQGRTVYEWEQSLAEVAVYVPVPPDVRAREIFCDVEQQHLRFGRKGNPPFLDLDLHKPVKVSDCIWTLEDGVLHISLTKLKPGEPWAGVIAGHELNPAGQEADSQRLLLERFQRENPGFDFSQASFNGAVPEAHSFMGGLNAGALRD